MSSTATGCPHCCRGREGGRKGEGQQQGRHVQYCHRLSCACFIAAHSVECAICVCILYNAHHKCVQSVIVTLILGFPSAFFTLRRFVECVERIHKVH